MIFNIELTTFTLLQYTVTDAIKQSFTSNPKESGESEN